MASNASSLILGLSIIAAAAIYAAPPLVTEFKNQNIISTTNGGARLGKIYNEALKVKMEIKNTESGDVFISVDENAERVYEAAKTELEKIIKISNKDSENEKKKISLETASLKVHMTVTLSTYVTYRSEHQPVYNLNLDEHETTAGIGANINRTLMQAQEYSDKMRKEFAEKHQLLKI